MNKHAAHTLAVGILLAGFATGMPAHAQAPADAAEPQGKQAGTFMVRVRAIGVMPQTSSSSISVIGGGVNASYTAAPEIDLSYFLTDHFALEAIAATTRHQVSASRTAAGRVSIGNVWVLPPTLTLQYHFMPSSRFSPYVGAGLTVGIFYDSQATGPGITKFGLSNNVGPAIQAGVDYNISGHWFANFDVKQIFLNTTARINGGAIIAKTALNPLVVGAGVGYRF